MLVFAQIRSISFSLRQYVPHCTFHYAKSYAPRVCYTYTRVKKAKSKAVKKKKKKRVEPPRKISSLGVGILCVWQGKGRVSPGIPNIGLMVPKRTYIFFFLCTCERCLLRTIRISSGLSAYVAPFCIDFLPLTVQLESRSPSV